LSNKTKQSKKNQGKKKKVKAVQDLLFHTHKDGRKKERKKGCATFKKRREEKNEKERVSKAN
jgi:hypothetical protein